MHRNVGPDPKPVLVSEVAELGAAQGFLALALIQSKHGYASIPYMRETTNAARNLSHTDYYRCCHINLA